MMSKQDKTFELIWREGKVDKCVRLYNKWTRQPRMLISRYENTIQNISKEVKRIANYLEINTSKKRCKKIASKFDIEKQKKRTKELEKKSTSGGEGVKIDERHQLHENHIQSGKSRNWPSALEWWQSALVEHRYGDWLSQNGYMVPRRFPGASVCANFALQIRRAQRVAGGSLGLTVSSTLDTEA